MKKYLIMILFVLLPMVAAYQECQRTVEAEDIPCMITTTWKTSCLNNVSIQNETGQQIGFNELQIYGDTGLCYWIFNFTSSGTYAYNYTDGDNGFVTVEVKMETIAMIIGIGIVVVLLFIFAFNLKDDHFLLKLLSLIFALITLMLIPATLLNGVETTKLSFWRTVLLFFRLFLAYISLFLLWHWAMRFEKFAKAINSIGGAFKK